LGDHVPDYDESDGRRGDRAIRGGSGGAVDGDGTTTSNRLADKLLTATGPTPVWGGGAEPGATPLLPVVLQWATFSAARDEAGDSRRQGGIHFPDADHNGRTLGTSVGQNALTKSQTYFNGTAAAP
jgi:hypothetical protein